MTALPPLSALQLVSNGRGCNVALDRPITIGIRGIDDYNDAGQFVPGIVQPYSVGATVLDLTNERDILPGGARNTADRVFRIRWFPQLAVAPITSVSLTDELGLSYRVGHVSEYAGRYGDVRHRWLDVRCTREPRANL